MPQESIKPLFIGTYTSPLPHAPFAKGRGIYAAQFDQERVTLEVLGLAAELEHPSFLALHPSRKTVYAASEVDAGRVTALAVDGENLRELGSQSTQGHFTAHVSVDPAGQRVFAANYGNGEASVIAFEVREDGALGAEAARASHTGQGPNEDRQEGPHPHCITPGRGGLIACAADLGTDEVVLYSLQEGALLKRLAAARVPGGSGPRHLVFHPGGQLVFCTLELAGAAASLRLSTPEENSPADLLVQYVTPAHPRERVIASELQLSPDGRFLYVSTRENDAIAVFEVDEATGALGWLGSHSTRGRTPRHFTLSPNGAFLLVGNLDSDSVTVFARHPSTGRLEEAALVACPTPACLAF
ncbi:lactonase family protein [Deinococcus peraridilitoris]|uniref:3-carboxymuconate cyclase n=1 Tax=Deinococcus peraridilitoris (strain DSM 19664 / LMG 22246 / CIP 109416 / KR-200) TaxID=937777 RepID=L0A2U3_DEIPD|nr:lactonase family protein [Deinococcus peraridilitoris]AFZ68203.1 3-carboxymuconate cyclase [Deinococcus peraridilitoris DSM 19664]